MGSEPVRPQSVIAFDDRIRVGTVNRSKLKDSGGSKANIKTLMSKEDRVVDLDITAAAARLRKEADLIAMRDADPEHCRRGLLLLYPIDKMSQPDETNKDTRVALDAPAHVIGLAMVFPGNADPLDRVENTYVQVDTRDAAIDDSAREEERAALSEEDT
jgi:hypothetical protein